MVTAMIINLAGSARARDAQKTLRFETRAADEKSVHLRDARELRRVLRLDAAAVKDAAGGGLLAAPELFQQPPHLTMDRLDLLGRCVMAGADRPDRLVRDRDQFYNIFPQPLQRGFEL